MDKEIPITVFTPTYNRGYIIDNLYKSLLRQTVKKFKWLIIDDGSTDDTKQKVKKWQDEKKIDIKYVYQKNQGMCGAHNTAYEIIDTELNMCIDSDDYLVDNAIEIILKKWNECDKKNTAGIIALDAYSNGKIIGTKMPTDISTSKIYDLYYRKKVKGDKKLIYRTDLTKKFKYNITPNEKVVSTACKYYRIDQIYELNILNEVVCIVEYQESGMSNNVRTAYLKNPNGNIEFAKMILEIPNALKFQKMKQAVHYVGNSFVLRKDKKTKEGKRKNLYYNMLSIRLYMGKDNK